MDTLLNALRSILGEPDFYKQLTSSSNYTWDYGAMIEYIIGGLLLLVVVSSIFKFLHKIFLS